ncbi:MAG TPA: hypothetical protein VLV86_21260, partial [Vicinamibacterales bacterium]|nr:hypothetical protein [Vicinamibacterales bacterium]
MSIKVTCLPGVIVLSVLLAAPAMAAGRRVLFVDASRGGGDGSFDHPFATIGEAVAAGSGEAVIYVAETP